jgi:hypothetical protein
LLQEIPNNLDARDIEVLMETDQLQKKRANRQVLSAKAAGHPLSHSSLSADIGLMDIARIAGTALAISLGAWCQLPRGLFARASGQHQTGLTHESELNSSTTFWPYRSG